MPPFLVLVLVTTSFWSHKFIFLKICDSFQRNFLCSYSYNLQKLFGLFVNGGFCLRLCWQKYHCSMRNREKFPRSAVVSGISEHHRGYCASCAMVDVSALDERQRTILCSWHLRIATIAVILSFCSYLWQLYDGKFRQGLALAVHWAKYRKLVGIQVYDSIRGTKRFAATLLKRTGPPGCTESPQLSRDWSVGGAKFGRLRLQITA